MAETTPLPPRWRLWLLRAVYLLLFVGMAPRMWAYVVSPGALIEPHEGVGNAFYVALASLALIGVRFPLTMLPLLLLQLFYKAVWLIFVGWPLIETGELSEPLSDGLFRAMAIGVVLDLLLIPWVYVGRHYFVRIIQRDGGV